MSKKSKVAILLIAVILSLAVSSPIVIMVFNLFSDSKGYAQIKTIDIKLQIIEDENKDPVIKNYKTDKGNIYDFLTQTSLIEFDEYDVKTIKFVNGKSFENGEKFYIYKNNIEVKKEATKIPIYNDDIIKIIKKQIKEKIIHESE
ncbi:MAG: hypothetical protein ACRCZK_05120 [Oscillospiraceae bacterium]